MNHPRRIIVLGTMANVPYAGMAWMHGQFLMGLARMGHDVFYAETTSAWPYHPLDLTTTDDPTYALQYLAEVMRTFQLEDRWLYRPRYGDNQWRGPRAAEAETLIRSADAVLNITGATNPEELDIPCRLVYIGTDPVIHELRIANGDLALRECLAAHTAHFTYGENIGRPECPVPPLPFPFHPLRQPVVLDLWQTDELPRRGFTTVTNWEVSGYDVEYQGEVYTWSKHREYLKILDLPTQTNANLELAMGLSGVSSQVRNLLTENGWSVVDAYRMSLDPWTYRDYIRSSSAELSVAKDMVVRTRSGWFSERSACYLAAGRPVVAQDTGFSRVLPTGEGLFGFSKSDDILKAIDEIRSDYPRHRHAALEIAHEYFRAENVLGQMLNHLGL